MTRAEALDISGDATGVHDLVLEISPEPSNVRTARLFAAAAARHFGVEEDRVEDLKIAISEACTNAIQSHLSADLTTPVRVVASADDNAMRFDVVDAAPGSASEPVPEPGGPPYTPPFGVFDGSLGASVIRAIFPDVEMTSNPGGGMTISMRVERPADAG